ncbi:DUF2231 domain-containing protein [Streptomyces avicenniae]|uniref:DUF2231 domain-containing protein n=1 Tax=Streptomyces avicenniae TaxID=500153 RepID=UPI0006992C15|nr:DUF2231 domain-containing protein [Streptomyces avicenniae]
MDHTPNLSGLPIHPLVVHAVVVLLPLTVLALLLAQFWPAARRRLGVVTPLGALAVAVLVPVTISAGESLAEVVGPLPAVERHERYGRMLLPWALALLVVAVAQWVWFRWGRDRARLTGRAVTVATAVLGALAVLVAAGSTYALVRAGDSGAEAVWGGLLG